MASYGYDTIKTNQNDCIGYWETANCTLNGKRQYNWITTNVPSGNGKTCNEVSNYISTTKGYKIQIALTVLGTLDIQEML